ncbi:hypothetical protein JOC78_003389 [Bacillus ectoiniformans]|uniref:hypothetical protein n=1 Tax=Bacillus ectoiniformans TaxID=1494429 RepID=UPI001EF9851A|nr:hypothetical protein [Bacillus ectoiniformans]MBM7650399.1 hypothetical protein [Bacillus ectoiniformans]
MKKFAAAAFVLAMAFIVSGCNGLQRNTDGGGLSGDAPPDVNIEVDGKMLETKLGSYCWGPDSNEKAAECVDAAGSLELLEGKEPIQVQAGEPIKIHMDYTPKPTNIHLSQVKTDDETEVEVNDHQFTAPGEKGTYIYAYSVWWMDEEDEKLSHGDASYVFAIKVK